VFKISPAGILTTLYTFTGGADGGDPTAPLVVGSDGNFYGTTLIGGINDYGEGTVFKLQVALETGCGVSVSATNAVFDAAGGPGNIGVTASNGCAWTATSNDSFITITAGSSGSGNGTIHYTVAANTSTNGLTGSMTIAGQTFTVTQSGASAEGCTYTLNATSVTLAHQGASDSVSVTTSNGCAWTAISNDGFILITSGSSGIGNGTVYYSVAANTSSSSLTGTMTLAGQTVTVTQSGTGVGGGGSCTYALNAMSVTIPAKGGSSTVSVKVKGTGCDWTAVSNAGFITITSGTSGAGNGTVKFTVPGNTSTSPLTGTITIAGQTFTVNQAAGGCSYSLSPKDEKFKDTGGAGTVKVTPNFSDCDWTAVSNDGFITVTASASGAGKGSVSYTVASNTNTVALTGSITIGGETFTVDEAAAPCEFSLGETAASFSSAGASSNVTVTANGTNCTWKAVVSGTFIQITSDTSGSGSGTVAYTVEANTKTATRKGTITVGKEKLTITQSGMP
jgi:uncharacterized repeat protein (TIGR03803 family)